nr:hypothetical protein [Tanacetum cinerariifolium]
MDEDPNPPEDDSEVRPLKEFIIKFTVMNGKKPLTLDYKTFCEFTRLDYNKGNYVAHPSLKAIKAKLDKIAIMRHWSKRPLLLTGNKVDIREIIFSDLVTRLTVKSRGQPKALVTYLSRAGTKYQVDKPSPLDLRCQALTTTKERLILKMYRLTEEQIQGHLGKEEKLQKATRKVRLSKPKLIKVVHEEATKAGVDPKALSSAKGGQEFIKIQDAKIKVLNREHSEKIKTSRELRKKRNDQYR